jgi:multidrug efflux system outer membrane protein
MKHPFVILIVISSAFLIGCSVGPNYERPLANVPANWKEDGSQKEKSISQWWKVFGDENLNAIEEQALQENQNLKRAASRVTEARAIARIIEADFFPDLKADPSFARSRASANRANPTPFRQTGFTSSNFKVPFDLSYEIDIWGRVRRSFEASVAEAEAVAAVYRTVWLTLTSDLAQNYFLLRALDAEKVILERTRATRQESLEIARARYQAGLVSNVDVTRAETELATTEAEIPDITRRRAELEHAIALLCGKAPADLSLAFNPIDLLPPKIPAGLPSELLERRPDILEAERLMAATSAKIGVATAAFFPSVRLTGTAGFESAELSSFFDWQSRIWSFGPSVSIPIFQGGRNTANLKAAEARYEQAVAEFRHRTLIAFREVEDALVNLRSRSEQAEVQARAITSARETTALVKIRYKEGLINYNEVADVERLQLQTERAATQILGQRLAYTIVLVKALGGGWN